MTDKEQVKKEKVVVKKEKVVKKIPLRDIDEVNNLNLIGEFDTDKILMAIESEFDMDIDKMDDISECTTNNLNDGSGSSNIKIVINDEFNIHLYQVINGIGIKTDSIMFIYKKPAIDIVYNLKEIIETTCLIEVPSGDVVEDELVSLENTIFYIGMDRNNQFTLTPLILGGVTDESKKVRKMVKSINNDNKKVHIISSNDKVKRSDKLLSVVNGVDKQVIFIPVNMVENTLNNLDFIEMIYEHKDKVFVIENCDKFFDKMHISNIFVSNMVQLFDSLISTELSFNFILTTSDIKKIDSEITDIGGKVIDINGGVVKHL